jgi:hypothetical protein
VGVGLSDDGCVPGGALFESVTDLFARTGLTLL